MLVWVGLESETCFVRENRYPLKTQHNHSSAQHLQLKSRSWLWARTSIGRISDFTIASACGHFSLLFLKQMTKAALSFFFSAWYFDTCDKHRTQTWYHQAITVKELLSSLLWWTRCFCCSSFLSCKCHISGANHHPEDFIITGAFLN